MSPSLPIILFFVVLWLPKRVDLVSEISDETILCRSCGHEVASNQNIFFKQSPNALYFYNDTLFKRENVNIQVFLTDWIFFYPVVSFTHATCKGVDEWEEGSSWFPGYKWKPCICPECGAYIGWVFEPIIPSFVTPPKTFFGLILQSLIGETYYVIKLWHGPYHVLY